MKTQVDLDWLNEAMELRPRTRPGTRGECRVEKETHPAGERLDVVTFRTGYYTGYQPTQVAYSHPIEVRSLYGKSHGRWMADHPQEIWGAYEAIKAIIEMGDARLLIGGLGLGVYTELALHMTIAKVTTIERSADVIGLVKPFVGRGRRHTVVNRCIYEYARDYARTARRGRYQVALLDTWQGTGERCLATEVIPLRRLVRKSVEVVHCWSEGEMLGQFREAAYKKLSFVDASLPPDELLYRSLRAAAEAEGLDVANHNIVDLGPDALSVVMACEAENRSNPAAVQLIDKFGQDIGSPEWGSAVSEFIGTVSKGTWNARRHDPAGKPGSTRGAYQAARNSGDAVRGHGLLRDTNDHPERRGRRIL